jgi:hypothetical protein
VTNYGNAFTPSIGVFRAKVAGLYFFSTSATARSYKKHPSVHMKRNAYRICELHSGSSAFGQSMSCSTVQYLAVGDEVYVVANHAPFSPDLNKWGTHFSGFLIVAD